MLGEYHPGVLVLKYDTLGAKLLKWSADQVGVKSAKLGLLARYTAEVVARTGGPSTKRSSLRCRSKTAKVRHGRSLHKKVFTPWAKQNC